MTNFAAFRHSIAARFIRLVRRFAGAAAIEDSTKREAELLAQRFKLATEVAAIGIFDWDLATDHWYATPMYFTMLGYEPDEGFVNRNIWLQRAHPEDRDAVAAKIAAVLAGTDTRYEYEGRIRHAAGHYCWIHVVGRVLERDENGKAKRLLGVRMDITQRKRAEAEILKLNAELEQRVLERTAQLESAIKELEAFSYSVSHDLKAPLRGIDGYSQLLEENYRDSLGEEGRVFLHKIRHGAAQMHELIGDMLAYSRMERRSLENTALELSSCVDAVVLAYTQQIAAHGIVLRADVAALTVHADRDGLAIALRNLLDNAIKFSRAADPPTIEIGARAEGGKVILWIRDNGIGFDMKFQEKIFEIFSRLQRSEDYPGTGVGLALVRKAMQRMGGRVWAQSVPAQGSTFFLEINA